MLNLINTKKYIIYIFSQREKLLSSLIKPRNVNITAAIVSKIMALFTTSHIRDKHVFRLKQNIYELKLKNF